MGTPRSWPEGVWPTAEQLAEWLVVCTAEERVAFSARALELAQEGHRRLVGLGGHARYSDRPGEGTGALMVEVIDVGEGMRRRHAEYVERTFGWTGDAL